jgi:hypothetical protein
MIIARLGPKGREPSRGASSRAIKLAALAPN